MVSNYQYSPNKPPKEDEMDYYNLMLWNNEEWYEGYWEYLEWEATPSVPQPQNEIDWENISFEDF
jgi:hypothetical protein